MPKLCRIAPSLRGSWTGYFATSVKVKKLSQPCRDRLRSVPGVPLKFLQALGHRSTKFRAAPFCAGFSDSSFAVS